MPIIKVVRTPESGAWGADHFPGFGTVLRPVKDPEGVEITKEMANTIRLDPSFPRIPPSLANRISDLYIEMLNRGAGKNSRFVDSQKEVSVVLLRDVETLSKWRVLVPTQVVGGASVNADYEKPLCDIETGETITSFPPDGWAVAGTSHSHNTMGAFFSGTDDRNELPQPGLHFVCGAFRKAENGGWNFDVAASMVYHGKRYESVIGEDGKPRKMVWTDIVDFTRIESDDYDAHKNCYEFVKVEAPPDWDHAGFSRSRGRGVITRYGGDYSDFGFGLDDYDREFAAYYYGDHRGGHSLFVPHNLDEIDGDFTDAAFEEWCRAYDKRVDDGKHDFRTQPKPKPDTPILAWPVDLGDIKIEPRDKIDTRDTLWAVRQIRFGSAEIGSHIVYVVTVGDKKEYWAEHTPGSASALVRLEPILHRTLTKHAKKQRRGERVGQRANAKDSVVVPITFATRGVRSDEFTQVEIENMIEAWASNLKQRSDLRIAIRKALGNHHDGTSRR